MSAILYTVSYVPMLSTCKAKVTALSFFMLSKEKTERLFGGPWWSDLNLYYVLWSLEMVHGLLLFVFIHGNWFRNSYKMF